MKPSFWVVCRSLQHLKKPLVLSTCRLAVVEEQLKDIQMWDSATLLKKKKLKHSRAAADLLVFRSETRDAARTGHECVVTGERCGTTSDEQARACPHTLAY